MPYNKGMDWLRLPKRMAIYHRDLFDCVWCKGVFPIDPLGYGLTLDHLDPTKGHSIDNLITCCRSCNASKRDTPLKEWYKHLAAQGHNVRYIRRRVQNQISKPINLDIGKVLAYARRPEYQQLAEELSWIAPLIKTDHASNSF
jgi:hypothetical protein